jgi:hypothetical protein
MIANYWTSGKKFSAEVDSFGWCVGENVPKIEKSSVLWASNEPGSQSDGQNCLQFKMDKKIGKISLYDRNCSSKFAYVCEVKMFY